MGKNPYYNDWIRSIESMNEEDLVKILEEGSRDEEYLTLVRERLVSLSGDNNTPPRVGETPKKKTAKVDYKKELKKEVNNSAENTLSFLAVVTLVVGMIAGIILFVECIIDFSAESYILFAAAISIVIGSLITWASIKVFVNISKTLKEINYRLSHIKD